METTPNISNNAFHLPPLLLNLLSNSLVLSQTTPYLPVSSLLALGATSKSFRDLIHRTPSVFRYLDLRNVKSAQFEIANIDNGGEVWRNVQLDENVTEDEFVPPQGTMIRADTFIASMADLFYTYLTLSNEGISSKMYRP